jgi:hypothetical protein
MTIGIFDGGAAQRVAQALTSANRPLMARSPPAIHWFSKLRGKPEMEVMFALQPVKPLLLQKAQERKAAHRVA